MKITLKELNELESAYIKVAQFYGFDTIGTVLTSGYYKGQMKFAWSDSLYSMDSKRAEKAKMFTKDWKAFQNILDTMFTYTVDSTFESKLKITVTGRK